MDSQTNLTNNIEDSNVLFYNYKTSESSNTDVIFVEEPSKTLETLNLLIGENQKAFISKYLNNNNHKTKALIITEKKLYEKFQGYTMELVKYLNLNAVLQFIEEGDFFKQATEVERIHEFMLENNFEKNCIVIGLGGGKITDLSGFIASTYFRGVNLILIPSNLLSMVDASIGGKTGINHYKYGKNVIGTISQPNT